MPEPIYPLNVDVAAELRDELTALDAGTEWRVTRLCEQAQAAGYHAGYIRGRVDGRHREQAEHVCPTPASSPSTLNRDAVLDVLTVADEVLHNEHGGDGALMNRNYLEYLADRLVAADAIAGTP